MKTLEDFGVEDGATLCVSQDVLPALTSDFRGDGRNAATVAPEPISE